MLIASESRIHEVYDELQGAVGSGRLFDIIETAFADDFVYTDPATVLIGRDSFAAAMRELRAIRSVDGLEVQVRDLGSHAVVTGVCSLRRGGAASHTAYVFNALWRRVAGTWLCVAQRGASALMSDPVGR